MPAEDAAPPGAPTRPLLSAEAIIAAHGFDFEPTPTVVVVYDESLVPTRRRRRSGHPFRRVARTRAGRGESIDVVLAAGPGAPVAAVTVEFLAAFGVARIVSVGICGVLDGAGGPQGARPLVVRSAVSDEGTSNHYGGNRCPDTALTELLGDALHAEPVTAVTTDVPFRQTPDRLEKLREVGDVIEMEAAALFAAADLRGVAAASILVAGDRFASGRWMPAPPTTTERLADVLADVVHVLSTP